MAQARLRLPPGPRARCTAAAFTRRPDSADSQRTPRGPSPDAVRSDACTRQRAHESCSGAAAALPRRGRGPRVSRNVVLLGLTSLFTDLSAEMVATILPLYLIYGLGLSPFQFGVVDGLYQGVTALVRVGGGLAADRWRVTRKWQPSATASRRRASSATWPWATRWARLSSIVVVDRIGKGIRTAPRDALISLSAAPREARDRIRRAPGARHSRRDAGAARRVRRARGRSARLRRRLRGQLLRGARSASASWSCSSRILRPRARPPRTSSRLRAGRIRTARHEALPKPSGRRGRPRPLYDQRRVSLPRAFSSISTSTSASCPCCSWALRSRTCCWPFRSVGSPIVSVAGGIRRRIPAAVAGLRVAAPAGGGIGRAPALPAARRVLLRGHRRGPHGACEHHAPGEAAWQRPCLLVTATSLTRLLASVILGAIWTWVGFEAAVFSFGIGLILAIALAGIVLGRIKEDAAYA